MTSPGPDWVEQARRFAAGLAAEHAAGNGLADVLGGLLGPSAAADHEAPAPEATGRAATGPAAAECRWCPLCVGLAALRGHRPDLVEALADVLASAAAALRTAAGAPADVPAGTRTTPDGSAAAPDAPARDVPVDATPEETVPTMAPAPAPVQRIDVA